MMTTHALTQPAAALLEGQSFALAYSPFREKQHPDGAHPTQAELLEDLRIIRDEAGCRLIRLYDAGPVSEAVLDVIEQNQLGLRVMLGAWLRAELSNHEGCAWLSEPIPEAELAENAAFNRAEVDRAVRLANAFPSVVAAVNVGNEALVHWNDHLVTTDALLGYARRVKAETRVPVTTAENYAVWQAQGPRLMEVLDFAGVHTYPVWEHRSIDEAMAYTTENLEGVRRALPGARIVIAEAGWPTVASEFPEQANERNQGRYVAELRAWADAHNITTFVFEAFDESWKGDPNDPEGAEKHWGLFNIDRTPKRAVRT